MIQQLAKYKTESWKLHNMNRKKEKNYEGQQRDLWNRIKYISVSIVGVPEEKREQELFENPIYEKIP